jgi:hypothetical protein
VTAGPESAPAPAQHWIRLTDIVAKHAGGRLGEAGGQEMIAARIGPDMRIAVVGGAFLFQPALDIRLPVSSSTPMSCGALP